MKKIVCTVFLALAVTASLLAQTTPKPTERFRISGQIKGLKDSTCVLAHWYGPTQYIPKDTAKVDPQGRLVFEGDKLPQGLYLVLTPKQRYFELIITDEQSFSFETDTTNFVGNMKIKGTKENEAFYGYQQQMGKFYEESQAIDAQRKLRNDAVSNAMFNKKKDELAKQAQDYRINFLKEKAGLFTVKLLSASAEPEVPNPPKAANGRPDSLWQFNYYKQHYWDGLDLTDERFLRTPLFQRKLERYVKELTVQTADSLIKEGESLIAKSKANKDVMLYIIYYFTSQYEQPKILGTDEVFLHMAEKYYLTGIMPLSDEAARDKVRERVNILKPLMNGRVLPAPTVSDTLKRPIDFMNIKSEYLVVFLYDPECGHCREATPKLKKFAEVHSKDTKILAIAVDKSPEDWRKYIKEFGVQNWIHGYDFTFRTNYRQQYDVYSTPVVYVLDKDKKILARRMPVEQLDDYFQFLARQKQELAKKDPAAAKTAAPKGK